MARVPTTYGTLSCPKCESRNTRSTVTHNVRDWACEDCGETFDTRQWFNERRAKAESRQVA